MAEIDVRSDEYTSAMAELTGFIEETKKAQKEVKPKKFFGFRGKEPVPRKEAASPKEESKEEKEEALEEPPQEEHKEEKQTKSAREPIGGNNNYDPGMDELVMDDDDFAFSDEDIFADVTADEAEEDSDGECQEETDDEAESSPNEDQPEDTEGVVKDEDDETVPEDGEEDSTADDIKHEIIKSDFGRNKVSTHVEPRPRYIDASELVATISVECAETAVDAMRALREDRTSRRPVIMMMVRDDGLRDIKTFKTKEAANLAMKKEMDFYINEIEPKDYMKIVYMDTGENERIYEPTPVEEIDEDGTIKRPSEIDGTLHVVETENRGIVYFESKNATARWDIFDLDEAVPGDPPDPAYEQYKEEMTEEAKEKKAEETPKKAKFKLF